MTMMMGQTVSCPSHHAHWPLAITTTGQPLANNRNRQTVTARIIHSERLHICALPSVLLELHHDLAAISTRMTEQRMFLDSRVDLFSLFSSSNWSSALRHMYTSKAARVPQSHQNTILHHRWSRIFCLVCNAVYTPTYYTINHHTRQVSTRCITSMWETGHGRRSNY